MEVVLSLMRDLDFTTTVQIIVYSSKLQFNLSVGIIGVIYLASTVTYAVCNILAGLMSDKLVSFPIYFVHRGYCLYCGLYIVCFTVFYSYYLRAAFTKLGMNC